MNDEQIIISKLDLQSIQLQAIESKLEDCNSRTVLMEDMMNGNKDIIICQMQGIEKLVQEQKVCIF